MSQRRQLVLDLRTVSTTTGALVELEGDDGIRVHPTGSPSVLIRGPEAELRQYLAGFIAGWAHRCATMPKAKE